MSGQPADQAFSGSKPFSPSALKRGAESVLVPRQERTGDKARATQAALRCHGGGAEGGDLQTHGWSRKSLSTAGTGFSRTCFHAVKPAPHICWGPPIFLKIKFNVSKSAECFGSRAAWRVAFQAAGCHGAFCCLSRLKRLISLVCCEGSMCAQRLWLPSAKDTTGKIGSAVQGTGTFALARI